MNRIKIFVNLTQKYEFDKKLKGLQAIENANELSIYSDPFCSVPLYICNNGSELLLFSNFEHFYENNTGSQIDKAGFWETVIYGTPLWTRTLYSEIKMLPAASKLTINKRTLAYDIQRYWDFSIEQSPINCIRKTTEKLHEQLNRIFDLIDNNYIYHMGLSGGLDSRLSLAYLSARLNRDQLKLFTFGFDERILEHKYANSVANELGHERVNFHKLLPQTYREALEYMPRNLGGEISIAHCHILSYLKEVQTEGHSHISNYYSDAVFGYSTTADKLKYNQYEDTYSKILRSANFIEDDIVDVISEDINRITNEYDNEFNYSSIDEYIYITERNPRFHMLLAHSQSNLANTLTPYANIDLLKLMMSIPLKFREQKVMLDRIFQSFFPKLSKGVVSSRDSSRFTGLNQWMNFRSLNGINAFLRAITSGRKQLLNKYQTEELDRTLCSDFHKDLKCATRYLRGRDLINDKAKSYFDRIPFRAKGANERYSLITLWKLMSTIGADSASEL